MKIGIVCYPTLGGSGVVATELGHELALRGHEVHFITYEIPFRLNTANPNIFFHQVEINRYDLFRYPDYALPLAVTIANVARDYQLDILHVHYAIPHATSAYLARQILKECKPAIITTLHGTDITLVGRDPAYFDIVKFSIENSDAVTTVSKHLKNETCAYFDICKSVEVIYNFFIPKPEIKDCSEIRNRYVTKDQKLLLHSSNYRSVKRPEDVIEIFERVKKVVPSKLLLLGSGGELEKVRYLVRAKGLSADVIYVGLSRDIDSYVACADLFLLPSEQESFGLAALEAMAYGVPVVATNIGGLPELIEDGISGFLSPLGDIEKMTQDSIKLLTNPTLHKQMAEAAQLRAFTKFGTNEIVPKYEALYQRVVR